MNPLFSEGFFSACTTKINIAREFVALVCVL